VEKTAPGVWSRAIGRGDPFDPPWPDVLITCGRRSAPLSIVLREKSGGAIFTVHIQDPRRPPSRFDLVVAMEHDRLPAGPNVIEVATALHGLTPEILAAAGAAWSERFAGLGRPMAGIMIGGSARGNPFTDDHGRRLLAALERLRGEAGAALAITPSRRTPAALLARLRGAFEGDRRVFIWDGTGENPYAGILALSDRLVVTGDSVSMVSEALATGRPVEVFDLGFRRYAPFLRRLEARGLTRRFEGDASPPPVRPPVNATFEVAAVVRRLAQGRTGVSGKASWPRSRQSAVT
ncbi:MAG: mitochondrial fission ELM1 family protein, partial [Caulobacteraceae bacterium]